MKLTFQKNINSLKSSKKLEKFIKGFMYLSICGNF